MSERWKSPLCLLLLAIVFLIFFWPLLVGDHWIPNGGGDLVSFLWPMYRFAARSLRSGQIPLWNPHLYSGAPFVADNQTSVFYPVNLVVFALLGEPSYNVMQGLVVFHIWLAGATMFALLRSLKLSRPAALLGGIAFALSDLFVTHIGNLNLNATAAWLPLLLLFTLRAFDRRSWRWAVAAGAVLAVVALAGHGQMLLFCALAFGLFTLYRLAADYRRGWRHHAKTVGLALLAVLVGVGGSALALFPSMEMAQHTGRGHLAFEEATRYSLPPQALLGTLIPNFYGRGPANFWGPWERVEVGYLGVVALVLALIGGWWVIIQRDRRALFFVGLVPLAFLLAMGEHTPLYGLLYRYLPTFDQVRAPARLILLADLGLAVLAAFGFHSLLRGRFQWDQQAGWLTVAAAVLVLVLGLPATDSVPLPADREERAVVGVIVAAVILGLMGVVLLLRSRHRQLIWLSLPLLAAELILMSSTLEIEDHDPTAGFQHQDVVDFLQSDAGFFRIESTAGAWQPDAALVHGLYDMGGIYNPLGLAPYDAYRWAVGGRGTTLHNLLGVKYVLTDKGESPGGGQLLPVYTDDPELDVYMNIAALPRVLLVYRSQVVPGHGTAWAAIHAPDFDPTKVVILEQGLASSANPDDGEQHLAFLRYDLNRVEVAVTTPTDAWLLLTDVYYPGWQARVDGELVDLLRADYVFRAVPVPAGEHVVSMVFRPWTWHAGVVVSGLTWLALAVMFVQCARSILSLGAERRFPSVVKS